MLVWEEGKDFVGLKKTDIRDERIDPPEPVPPGESQTPEYGGTQPQLTEAVLLNLGADAAVLPGWNLRTCLPISMPYTYCAVKADIPGKRKKNK